MLANRLPQTGFVAAWVAFFWGDGDGERAVFLTVVEVFAGPTASRGPAAGNRWIYFLAPWGMQFELVSYPAGKKWDREQEESRRD